MSYMSSLFFDILDDMNQHDEKAFCCFHYYYTIYNIECVLHFNYIFEFEYLLTPPQQQQTHNIRMYICCVLLIRSVFFSGNLGLKLELSAMWHVKQSSEWHRPLTDILAYCIYNGRRKWHLIWHYATSRRIIFLWS